MKWGRTDASKRVYIGKVCLSKKCSGNGVIAWYEIRIFGVHFGIITQSAIAQMGLTPALRPVQVHLMNTHRLSRNKPRAKT